MLNLENKLISSKNNFDENKLLKNKPNLHKKSANKSQKIISSQEEPMPKAKSTIGFTCKDNSIEYQEMKINPQVTTKNTNEENINPLDTNSQSIQRKETAKIDTESSKNDDIDIEFPRDESLEKKIRKKINNSDNSILTL